ncbi:MAG: arginase family protein [Paracoccaceae bacterium]
MPKTILIGAPIDSGQKRPGCLMGPAAYRVAGLAREISALGHGVQDWGDLALPELRPATCANPAVHSLSETIGWTEILMDRVDDGLSQGGFPIIMGGDHSLALGSVAGAAAYAQRQGRPLFLIWLDAHSDFHTPLTTTSGNLHGTPWPISPGARGLTPFRPSPPRCRPAASACSASARSMPPNTPPCWNATSPSTTCG